MSITEDEAVDYLMNSLASVYCNSCRHDGELACDYCAARKEIMLWGISEETARQIVQHILGDGEAK